MSNEKVVDPVADAAERWARDFATRAGVVLPFNIKVMAGVTRAAIDFQFERLSEFAAARVVMSLIDEGHEVIVKIHADNWIRVSVSVENSLITQWEETWEGTADE
ncbi:hypothetical protein AB0465_14445 [Streptomyces griseoviridis]|uniref:hypothetical protein n=1 Tax=Streptomyces griseoviridis TaxID=45398 RepID=UPI00344CD3AA